MTDKDIVENKSLSADRYLIYIILYSTFIPINMYGILDIITLINKFLIESQLNKYYEKIFK